MSANWVVGAARIAGSGLDLLGTINDAGTARTFAKINDQATRQQIAIASAADANARIRATGNLISSQRAALGASGIAGGRTQRLLEARARINAGREQTQANQTRAFGELSSRLRRIQIRAQARSAVFGSATDLFTTALGAFSNPAGNPGPAGDG